MKVKIDWRRETVKCVCNKCIYYSVCEIDHDCAALEILVKINENLDCGNPNE